MWILADKQSGSLTRIGTMESVSLCRADETLTVYGIANPDSHLQRLG
jgi:hypothetical protein